MADTDTTMCIAFLRSPGAVEAISAMSLQDLNLCRTYGQTYFIIMSKTWNASLFSKYKYKNKTVHYNLHFSVKIQIPYKMFDSSQQRQDCVEFQFRK